MINAAELVRKIITEQELVIGPLAWNEAHKVTGLQVDIQSHQVSLEGNPREVLERLVTQYERLFGRASREVCRDAVKPLVSQVSQDQLPPVLR